MSAPKEGKYDWVRGKVGERIFDRFDRFGQWVKNLKLYGHEYMYMNASSHSVSASDLDCKCTFLSVLVRVEFCEDVVVLLLEDVDGHVEVVVLHRRGRVDGGQGRPHVDHELVVEAAVVEIMAHRSNVHRQALAMRNKDYRVTHLVGKNLSLT